MSSELPPALLLVELGDTDLKKNAVGTVFMTQLVHLSWGFPVCKAHTKGNNSAVEHLPTIHRALDSAFITGMLGRGM